MVKDLIILVVITMRKPMKNSIAWDFMTSAKIFIAITQENTKGLLTVSIILDMGHQKKFMQFSIMGQIMTTIL